MSRVREQVDTSNNQIYHNYYRKIIWSFIGALLFLIALVIFVLYQVSHRPLPPFTAVSTDGRSLALASHDQPNFLPSTILRWASKAAVAAYTFDFVNYQTQIANVRQYFTTGGWADYQNGVNSLVADIAQRQLFVNSVVSGPPIISNQGNYPGLGYIWFVQLPFLVTYQSSEKTFRQSFVVMMTIIKVPTWINPRGMGIDQFVMR